MRGDYLPPWVIQGTGLVVFLFFVGFWAVTKRVEPTLLAASGTLIGLGQYQQAKRSLLSQGEQSPNPPPVAKEPVEDGDRP